MNELERDMNIILYFYRVTLKKQNNQSDFGQVGKYIDFGQKDDFSKLRFFKGMTTRDIIFFRMIKTPRK